MPTVSIIIPTKNRCELLKECLASIQAQTFEDWEAIVCDDGSTDGTAEYVNSLAATDPRVRFLPGADETRRGAPCRRNDGFNASSGQFVMFLDDDDLLHPECLSGRLRVFEAEPELDAVIAQAAAFQDVPGDLDYYWNVFTDEDHLARFLYGDAVWPTHGPLWRREFIHNVGPWDEQARRWQDWEFHIRALAKNPRICTIHDSDIFWRVTRPGTISNAQWNAEMICDILDVVSRLKAVVSCNEPFDLGIDARLNHYTIYLLNFAWRGGANPGCFFACLHHATRIGLISRFRGKVAGLAARLIMAGRAVRPLGWALFRGILDHDLPTDRTKTRAMFSSTYLPSSMILNPIPDLPTFPGRWKGRSAVCLSPIHSAPFVSKDL